MDFAALDERIDSRYAGLLLAIPDLVTLDVGSLVAAAGYQAPATSPR